jgi:hypothetical protein
LKQLRVEYEFVNVPTKHGLHTPPATLLDVPGTHGGQKVLVGSDEVPG